MNKYRISTGLKPYVRRVLIRSFYCCHITTDENAQNWCYTDANSNTFHQIVQRAKCEKKEKETGCFYVTAKEAQNHIFLNYLLDRAQKTNFSVMNEKDWQQEA